MCCGAVCCGAVCCGAVCCRAVCCGAVCCEAVCCAAGKSLWFQTAQQSSVLGAEKQAARPSTLKSNLQTNITKQSNSLCPPCNSTKTRTYSLQRNVDAGSHMKK